MMAARSLWFTLFNLGKSDDRFLNSVDEGQVMFFLGAIVKDVKHVSHRACLNKRRVPRINELPG